MKPEAIIPDSNQCISSSVFHHFVGGFVLDIPCVRTDNKTVFVHDLYSLYDFTDAGDVYERAVRFYHAYLRGYILTIVIMDLESGELIKRKHRINTNILPCNWMLTETDFLDPTRKKDDLLLDFDY